VVYGSRVGPDEVFVSDGAKCDIGRLQLLFGRDVEVAVQDPSYPVYVDGSVIIGAAGTYDDGARGGHPGYAGIRYLPCTPENGYFPDLGDLPESGLIYFCSPNNPTGAVATHAQLAALVAAARQRGSVIVFDAAYAEYIRDPELPRSIFEVDGARECAIEVNSFSKPVGFTGVRLGWTVVPKELRFDDGASVNADWNRLCTTVFNGPSNIAQHGGLAALDEQGLAEMRTLTDHYLVNAHLIRATLEGLGITCVGGDNAPYIWAHFPGRASWDVFAEILERCHVVTTPGSGFGPAGRASSGSRRSGTAQMWRRPAAGSSNSPSDLMGMRPAAHLACAAGRIPTSAQDVLLVLRPDVRCDRLEAPDEGHKGLRGDAVIHRGPVVQVDVHPARSGVDAATHENELVIEAVRQFQGLEASRGGLESKDGEHAEHAAIAVEPDEDAHTIDGDLHISVFVDGGIHECGAVDVVDLLVAQLLDRNQHLLLPL
jgi:LL-diaminopimelate aminotransferase apoenzyme (EC 2.6.1.83)